MTGVPCSAAGVCPDAMNPNARMAAASCMVRISGTSAMRVPCCTGYFLVVAPRQDDVDMVVRENEAGGAGVGRDVDRDRPLALGQDRGHVPGALGFDQLGLSDRLAGGKRLTGDRARELIEGVGIVGSANKM